ncbi:MAG: hypothetical protein DHS20C06_17800 [Hyphobacterium sp.]|nr:MAG: hypothetical protein DHS20C06_17800 [Hyphobacterium sp.]
MSCSRGKSNPNAATRVKLFADSAGYCQNPDCEMSLFTDLSSGEPIHFAEMAHIFAAGKSGPRSNSSLTDAEKGAYENLILLCANCHTLVDKAPNDFPDELISKWKTDRAERIASLFSIKSFSSRGEVRAEIEPLLETNKTILEIYGPNSEARFNPESDTPNVWRRKILSTIIPNNKRILAVLDKNRSLMSGDEIKTVEKFRQHTDDLIARHVANADGGIRFPPKMNQLMEDAE